MKKIILSIILLASIATVYGQDFLLSEQWFSRLNRNPAATGNSENIELFAMHRQQWMGFKDAPKTTLLNAHSFFESISSGLGFTFYYDQLGISTKNLNAKLAYSYQLLVAKDMLLAFGVSGGVLNTSVDPDKWVFEHPNLVNINDIPESATNLDMDLGVEFSMPVFMAGFSVSHLLDSRDKMTNVTAGRQFTGYARGNIVLTNDFNLAPGLVYNNYSSSVPGFFELNATAFYKKSYWLGLGTRFNTEFEFTTLNAIVGVEWNMLRVGFGYDLSLGDLSKLSSNTCELMLSFRFGHLGKKKTTQKFVRFME